MSDERKRWALSPRLWAPIGAGLLVGALYWPRVDSVFYFLHGAEGHGLLLAQALGDGVGFVELSLPGHPAHVREPPLFYLALAGLIRWFGFRLYPMKVFMWAGYVATAVAGTVFFQRRRGPAAALLAMLLCLGSPVLFRFFTGPKSDVPFMALSLGALLAVEGFLARVADRERRSRSRLVLMGLGASALITAAVLVRSLALAILLGAAAATLLDRRGLALRSRVAWTSLVAAPVVIALGAWVIHTSRAPHPAGYTYLDWFLMDLKPDSPEMMAVDFLAPLAGPVPRSSVPGLMKRAVRHAATYALSAFDYLIPGSAGPGLRRARPVLCLLFFLLALLGAVRSERGRPAAAGLYLVFYSGAMLAWPMDDPRLLFPLLPFLSFYFVAGGLSGLEWISDRFGTTKVRDSRGESAGKKPAGTAGIAGAAAVIALILFSLHSNWRDYRSIQGLPRVSFQPGFEVAFVNREVMRSFQLLAWAGEHTPPGSVLMYHSPPPCRLISGRECRPIPFTEDLDRARSFIVAGGADYLVLDEWGRSFPTGPGWFVENVLRPLLRTWPADFEAVFTIPGTEASVYRVIKPGS